MPRTPDTALPRRMMLAAAAAVVLGGVALPASAAGLPQAYAPIVIQPDRTGSTAQQPRAEFDLTAAAARARQEKKWLYVYLGADDCRYCRKYEAFLDAHADELVPHFAKKYLVVDLRGSLGLLARQLFIKVDGRSLPYEEFQHSISDDRARLLVYPNVWLFDASGKTLKPLMQMPTGTGTFQTVSEQLEILQLVQ